MKGAWGVLGGLGGGLCVVFCSQTPTARGVGGLSLTAYLERQRSCMRLGFLRASREVTSRHIEEGLGLL